nr:proton-coupled zinc antiporter SLC30A2-like [Dermacentor andersoni]
MDLLRAVSSIHCHKNQNDEAADVDVSARRRLICASILCLTFMLFELVGGILANSLAIATDAAHLLTDFASFMISLFSLWMGARPATKRLSFGWYRAEVIGALTSVIMIWAVTGVLVYMAIQRMINKEYNIDATIMLISASVGVVVNIIMGLALQIHPTSPLGHSHGSEESARRFELLSTEPFVPHGTTASEMDSSRQCSRLNVFRSVDPRVELATGSLQAMSPQHVSEVGPSGHSASAPSMSSPPYNPSGPETPSAHHTEAPDAVDTEAMTPHEDATEQRGAPLDAVGPPPGSQRAKSSTSPEGSGALDFAAIRSGANQHLPGIVSTSRNVSENAAGTPGTATGAASVHGQPGVPQHDLRTSPDGQTRSPDDRHTSAGSLAQTLPQQPGAGAAPAPVAGSVSASPDPPPPRSSQESRGVMNINVRAAFIHVLGDLIQSVGVLVAAIVIYFCPSCGVVDPVCTLMFSVIVLVTTLAILREALNVLMEGIPHSVDYHQVKRLLLSVDGVARVHDLHIWALSLDKLAVSAHVVLVPGADAMSVRRSASRTIRRNFDVFKLTLQMEEFEEGIRQHCRRCSEPS